MTLLLNEALVSAPTLKHLKSTVVLLYTQSAVHKGSNAHKRALTETVMKPHVINQLFSSLSSCLTHFTLQTSLSLVSASFCLCFLFSNALSIIENLSAVNKWKLLSILSYFQYSVDDPGPWGRTLDIKVDVWSRSSSPNSDCHLCFGTAERLW